MASKRRLKRRHCSKKKCYFDRDYAERDRFLLKQRHPDQVFGIYELAGHWHIGHRWPGPEGNYV